MMDHLPGLADRDDPALERQYAPEMALVELMRPILAEEPTPDMLQEAATRMATRLRDEPPSRALFDTAAVLWRMVRCSPLRCRPPSRRPGMARLSSVPCRVARWSLSSLGLAQIGNAQEVLACVRLSLHYSTYEERAGAMVHAANVMLHSGRLDGLSCEPSRCSSSATPMRIRRHS